LVDVDLLVGRDAAEVGALADGEGRALAEHGRGPPAEPLDRADEVVRHVDDVRHQVAERSGARVRAEEPPRRRRVRPVRVVRQEHAAAVVDVADLAGFDEPARVLHGRREPVAEADAAHDAGPPRRLRHRRGVLEPAADGLLDPHVLARLDRGDRHLAMQRVGRR
jgi:hypothetical protein